MPLTGLWMGSRILGGRGKGPGLAVLPAAGAAGAAWGGVLSMLAAQARPPSRIVMATCTRLAAFSLVRMRDTWALTVASLMYRRAAMSALDWPRPTAAATWRSRSVSSLSVFSAVV